MVDSDLFAVVRAEGGVLDGILDATVVSGRAAAHSRAARGSFERAVSQTAWAKAHRRRVALTDGAELLASAVETDWIGRLDQHPVTICGISEVLTHPADRDGGRTAVLIERLTDAARARGVDLALVSMPAATDLARPAGFEVVPTSGLELVVKESTRRGAPMTLIRGGEDRDLKAIAAMDEARVAPVRFHLDRSVDQIAHAITSVRLAAGLARPGLRHVHFVIAEEGITAAAYVVISAEDHGWAIEECGDRDASGARVGAILQALIALEPAERRPAIRGRLPPGFMPPQIAEARSQPSGSTAWIRRLQPPQAAVALGPGDVHLWPSDVA